MAHYYVNDRAQENGDHEVHLDECSYMPSALNRTYLGDYASCAPAVDAARRHHRQVNGCIHCARPCHTS